MSEPNPPGENSPLRVGGLILLGIAAVAAVVGLISMAGNGSPGPAPAPPSSEAAPPPGPPAPPPIPEQPPPPASPPPPPAVPLPSSAPPPSSAGALPGAGLPDENDSGGGSGKVAAKAPVRVYNNSLVKNLAEHAAQDFRGAGWQVTEVGNYASGTIPTSTVYYRPGTGEQAAARSLASSFGLRAEPRFAGLANASPGLIVIVTKDYQHR